MSKRIILCEDDHSLRGVIKKYIEDYLAVHPIGEVVLSSDQPEAVLAYLEKAGQDQDCIFFLDIELNATIDGLDLAKALRKKDNLSDIIFLTSYDDYMAKAFQYKLKALDYISKDVDIEKRVTSCLEVIRNRMVNEEECWVDIHSGNTSYHNTYASVIAIEGTRNHKVRVVEAHKTYEASAALASVEKDLSYPFVKIHRSFIINTRHIKRHYREGQALYVEMTNGKSYAVSRKHSKEITRRDRYNT